MLAQLPVEVLDNVFAYLGERDLLREVRRVNGVFCRVATPKISVFSDIHLYYLRNLRKHADLLSSPSALSQAKRFTLLAGTWIWKNAKSRKCKADLALLAAMRVVFVNARYFHFQCPLPRTSCADDPAFQATKLIFSQLAAAPLLESLNVEDFTFRHPSGVAMLPAHLTHLTLYYESGKASIDTLDALLGHMPQLVSLDIPRMSDTVIGDKRLVDWVVSGMEQSKNRHWQMKELTLGFSIYANGSMGYERFAVFAYIFYMLPKLDSLDLHLSLSKNYRDKADETSGQGANFTLPPSIIANSSFPKHLSIHEQLLDNTTSVQRLVPLYPQWTPSLSQSSIECLKMYVRPFSSRLQYMHCFPCLSIKKVELVSGEPASVNQLLRQLQFMPLLQHLLLLNFRVNTDNTDSRSPQFPLFLDANASSLEQPLPVTILEIKYCVFDSPATAQRLLNHCPRRETFVYHKNRPRSPYEYDTDDFYSDDYDTDDFFDTNEHYTGDTTDSYEGYDGADLYL
ncbi:hypothetical protein BC940DRAFT_291199 [Gongronella butleri]|nr:hypothetical protein BC940DRAFT_291199 [Gongronella butleri]